MVGFRILVTLDKLRLYINVWSVRIPEEIDQWLRYQSLLKYLQVELSWGETRKIEQGNERAPSFFSVNWMAY